MTAKEALEKIKEIYIHNEYGESRGNTYDFGIECCSTIENALNELEDLNHNYKSLKEFYDNSVSYGSKIQNELNTLKKDVDIYKDTLDSIKAICNEPSPSMILSLTEIGKKYMEIDKLINTYEKKLSKVGKEK